MRTLPSGPFDAASCLLTLHFLTREECRRTLIEVRRRLKLGAPIVVAHLSFPQSESKRVLWLSRYVGFTITNGIDPEKAKKASAAISDRLHLLSPDDEEAMLYDAGFLSVNLFYMGFCFRG